MIGHIAVHPDYYRKGIGELLLLESEKRAKEIGLNRFEAWTRDDKWVQNWYEKMQFNKVSSYYHVYFEGNEMKNIIRSKVPNLYLVNAFAHYVAEDIEQFSASNKRIHECVCYEKYFD